MKIGFSKTEITPPVGTELGGYAGYRPCTGAHDPLWCKAVVLEQADGCYGLVVLDLMCVDEALQQRIAREVQPLGLAPDRLLVCAIHSHAAPQGSVPGEGPLDAVNNGCIVDAVGFKNYMFSVVEAARSACEQAVKELAPFRVRTARTMAPPVGSERHTGGNPQTKLNVLQFRTENRKMLTIYHFPCHPTVLSAANLEASADFVAEIENLLDTDMAVFVNGAAGDISTRYTRQEATFAECGRLAAMAAKSIQGLIGNETFVQPEPLKGIHTTVKLQARPVETQARAQKQLEEARANWEQAKAEGMEEGSLRILKSYEEGAWVNLEFARTMGDIRQLHLPVTVFRFCGLDFAAVPGELFSALQPEALSVIGYANGYYRYICGESAYDEGYYEAMAAILARGEGEKLIEQLLRLRQQLEA